MFFHSSLFIFMTVSEFIRIVNACARRLGSRAGPRTGKGERGFLGKASKKGEGSRLSRPPKSEGWGRFQGSQEGFQGVPSHRGGGGPKKGAVRKFCMGGRVGLGRRRPDPGLLVPDASRQEAEANSSNFILFVSLIDKKTFIVAIFHSCYSMIVNLFHIQQF